jgi:hypothetical protein
MEERPPGTTTRTASITDIAPGAPHVAFGDFLHDGRVNAIFVKPASLNATDAAFETYSLDPASGTWKGQGPIQAPPFFPRTTWRPSSNVFEGAGRLLEIDLDGDGLIGATPEGRKELVGFTDGIRESSQSWR